MADNKSTSQLAAAAALTGAELVALVQDGTDVQSTAQDIADLAAGSGPAGSSGDVQTNGGGSPATFAGLPVIGFVQWADGGANEVPIADGAGSGTWGAQSGGGIRSQAVTLSAADCATLDDPFTLVAAVDAQTVNFPYGFWVWSHPRTGVLPKNEFTGGFFWNNKNADEIAPGQSTQLNTVITTGTALMQYFPAQTLSVDNNYQPLADFQVYVQLANKPIVFQTTAADFTKGVVGSIVTSAVNSGGSGYSDGSTFTVTRSSGSLATGTVTAQTGGVVTAYTLDTAPSNYIIDTGVATVTTGGGGSGLTLDITALDYSANEMELNIVVDYRQFAVGAAP